MLIDHRIIYRHGALGMSAQRYGSRPWPRRALSQWRCTWSDASMQRLLRAQIDAYSAADRRQPSGVRPRLRFVIVGRKLLAPAIALVIVASCSNDEAATTMSIASVPSSSVMFANFNPIAATTTLPGREVGLKPTGGIDGPLLYAAKPTMDNDGYPLALIGGELQLADGCLTIDGNPVLWPYGYRWQSDPAGVVYPNGHVLLVGATIDSSGAYYGGPIGDLTSDPATIELGERCGGSGDGNIVLPKPVVPEATSV